MREEGAPFPDSTVTFRIEPGNEGGTLFRVIHRIEGAARLKRQRQFSRRQPRGLKPLNLAA